MATDLELIKSGKDDIRRILDYLDSQNVGFITNVDVTGVLRELCVAELYREPNEGILGGNVVLEFTKTEALWLRKALQGQISIESPDDRDIRLWVLNELPVQPPPSQFNDDEIPF